MDRDKVLELARGAMLFPNEVPALIPAIERFAALIAAEVRGDSASSGIHSCSYYCTRPECIKAQRDELRDKIESATVSDAEPDANRYRWLKENSARISWNPARFNEHIVDGFAAFGTGYLGYSFEQAIDLAMQAGDSND